MNFELGKNYIVDVTEKGIIPSMEFDRNQWFNKDYDDLDLLTDEEKEVIVKDVLDKIRAEIEGKYRVILKGTPKDDWAVRWNDCLDEVLEIIDKYRESEGSDADCD